MIQKIAIKGGHAAVKLYLSETWFRKFLEGEENACEYEGFYNEGESWVFLPLPGSRNASLRMIREGMKTEFSDSSSRVNAVVGTDGSLACFASRDGAIMEIDAELVSPSHDVYSRNRGLLETRCLQNKTVFIGGCGSVGSTVAAELAKAGIGRLVLVDPDRLTPPNICRHQAGLQHLGRLKVNAVKDLVLSINPFIEVETFSEDMCGTMEAIDKTTRIAETCDLLMCTTDTDNSRIFMNDLSLGSGKPSIHAGLHERASSGIVQSVFPGRGACFLCHREKILTEARKENGNLAYSVENSALVPIQPGISSQINAVAEVAVLKALEILTAIDSEEGKPSGFGENLTFIKTREKPDPGRDGHLTFSAAHFRLEASEKCAACGTNSSLKQAADPLLFS